MIQVIAAFRIKGTKKVVRILSGASCTSQILNFKSKKDLPKVPVISKEKAAEITGNYISTF